MAMRTFLLAVAASALTLAAPSAAPAKPVAKPAAKADWTKTIADTGKGWRMGNPAATTKLVEYGSFNCPHCAAFEKAAMPAIRKLVAGGKLSYEFRPKQLFPHDPSATLVALCAGKERVFGFTEDYMANAGGVLGNLRTVYKSEPAAFDKAAEGGEAGMARFLFDRGGMAPIAARAGVDAARANRCLGDPKLLARVEANEKAALAAGVTGTPTFFINGQSATIDEVKALGIPVAL